MNSCLIIADFKNVLSGYALYLIIKIADRAFENGEKLRYFGNYTNNSK
jgi:hypothetical protein